MAIQITISPLVKADIPAILEIEKQSQPEPWSEQSFLEELDRLQSYLLVARVGEGDLPEANIGLIGDIAGYICFWHVADEIQILNIAVHNNFRRSGIARELMAHAIRTGREKRAACVNLEVRKSNFPAIRLYEGLGFKTVGERPNYYGERGEPAILMELEIDPETRE